MIQRLRIKQFKSIVEFDQTLKPITVLVGANNSGKSSVLNAIHSAVAVAQSRLLSVNRVAMVPGGPINSERFTISVQEMLYLPLVDPSWLAPNARFTQTNGPQISLTFAGPGAEGFVKIVRGKNRNLSVDLTGNEVISRIEKIDQPFSIYVPGLSGIAKNEAFMALGSLFRSVARGDANLVLRNVLYVLNRTKGELDDRWTPFAVALKEVFAGRTIKVEFNPSVDEFIKVLVETPGAVDIPLDCMGTGFLQSVQILSYLFLFKPAVLLLDEPDSHLHPNNQRLLAQLLLRLAAAGTMRVLMATHSRHMIDSLGTQEEVKMIWMRNGSVEPSNEHIEVLADLGAFDNAERLLAGRIQYAVLTEDEDYSMLKTLLVASGLDEATFQIWAYKGCSKLDVAEALAKFITVVSPLTKILLYRDSDYLTDPYKDHLRAQFDRRKVKVFFPPGVDMEGLFCRIPHLEHLNQTNETIIRGMVTNAITDATPGFRESATKGWDISAKLNLDSGIAFGGAAEKNVWLNQMDFRDEKYVKGKILLPRLNERFQTSTGQKLAYNLPTSHLRFPELDILLAAASPAADTSVAVAAQNSGSLPAAT